MFLFDNDLVRNNTSPINSVNLIRQCDRDGRERSSKCALTHHRTGCRASSRDVSTEDPRKDPT